MPGPSNYLPPSDDCDSYHVIFAANLITSKTVQKGDLNHPAARVSTHLGGISEDLFASRYPAGPPVVPEYTPADYLALALQVRDSGLPNAEGLRVPVKSHLNIAAWRELLPEDCHQWAVNGVTFGFKLGIDSTLPASSQFWPNHGSCVRYPAEVNQFITSEVAFGAMYPLGHDPGVLPAGSANIPLLTVPKDGSKRRICGDASFPAGLSLNDSISESLCTGSDDRLRLPSVWDLLAHIPVIGMENVLLAKIDWARGYRQIPIDPADSLRQLFWLPQVGFIIDSKGIFGVKTMAPIQQHLHQAVLAAAHKLEVDLVPPVPATSPPLQPAGPSAGAAGSSYRCTLPYIDDGLFVLHRAVAASFWRNVLTVFRAFNLKISTTVSHICPPARKITALGFDIDLDLGTISIPPEKITELITWLLFIKGREEVALSDMKKLVGRIMRVAMVVECGRRFVNRLLDALRGPLRPGTALVSVSPSVAADLNWWLYTAPRLNSKSVIIPTLIPQDQSFVVDGRGRLLSGEPPAVGGLFYPKKQFFSLSVPLSLAHSPIHVIEAVALLVAVRLWVPSMPGGTRTTVGSDSMPVVDSVNHGRPREQHLQAASRLIWHYLAVSQVQLTLEYVPTKDNPADPLSRLDEVEVDRLLGLDWTQLAVPAELFSLSECL